MKKTDYHLDNNYLIIDQISSMQIGDDKIDGRVYINLDENSIELSEGWLNGELRGGTIWEEDDPGVTKAIFDMFNWLLDGPAENDDEISYSFQKWYDDIPMFEKTII